MRLAVSNIAWPIEEDAQIADMLQQNGVSAIEVAPTKIWPALKSTTATQVAAYRRSWECRGMQIVAAQALLFGKPDLTLFLDANTRQRTLTYLEFVIGLCADLGAESLVFGSPKNRRCGHLDAEVTREIATDFFGHLGRIASAHGTTVVLEANPPEYGADYATRADEALSIVQQVNQPGFRLHLDSACMTMSGDDVETVTTDGAKSLHHFHISEPRLASIGTGHVDHRRFDRALRSIAYDRWCSVEMRMEDPFTVSGLERALQTAQAFYSGRASADVA